MPIIAFGGAADTGKTTLASMLARELNCSVASFGDYVREQARALGIKNPRGSDLQDLGQRLVDEDMHGLCRAVLERANFTPGDLLVVDGIRHVEALEAISALSRGQPIQLIYLEATSEVRNARNLTHTPRSDQSRRDTHRVEQQTTREVMQAADLILDSNGELGNTFRQILDWVGTTNSELIGSENSRWHREEV